MRKHFALACTLALSALAACANPPSNAPATALAPIRVILVGDSTLAPSNGYGDALCQRFKSPVTCINLAKNGRSSGSYRAEGLWAQVQTLLADRGAYQRTYVLIEFGHNDQPGKPGRSTDLTTEFPVNLGRYVAEVRAAGGTPVLVTPLSRRSFKGDALQNDLQPWADATRAVASTQQVTLIDLLTASAAAVQAMGSTEADTLAVEPPPAVAQPASTDLNRVESVSTAKSAFDHTHVGPKGALVFAAMASQLLQSGVPELAAYLRPEESPPLRPQLSAQQAKQFAYTEVLKYAGEPGYEGVDPWDPLAQPITAGKADYLVDPHAPANGHTRFNSVQAAVNRAIVDAHGAHAKARVRILVKPGIYRELVYVPQSGTSITLLGDGPDAAATVITANVDASVTGEAYARQYAAQFAGMDASIVAMFESVKARATVTTFGTCTVCVRNAGFQARNITFENAYRREAVPATDAAVVPAVPAVQHQAVALAVEGADRAQFENLRLLALQDTLYLKTQDGGRTARIFFDKSYIEGDVDFIFGDATAFFYRSEIKSLGSRTSSHVGAPDTNLKTRYGLVFDHCMFTHDGSPFALAGNYDLVRQWFHNQKCTPFGTMAVPGYACTLGEHDRYDAPKGTISKAVLETVGKMVVLNSRIGSHISKTRPWTDWNQSGKLSYRPVQVDSDAYWAHLVAVGINPVMQLGYGEKPTPADIFLGEFNNSHD